ncbi:MAG: DUF2723 domain-containing protein [bacterium]|nr:DUF2723 domain-containing protein [bacterium]
MATLMHAKSWITGVSISFIVLLIYIYTLCPTVYVGDSGELTAAAYTLGIAHPPGYPLLCLVGKIFSWLPVGNIAYRINLMSAVFAAGAIFFLFLLLFKLTNNRFVASAGSLAFAFSHTFWGQANIGKSSYAINTFFISLILLCLYLWAESRFNALKEKSNNHGTRFLYLSGLFFGLGLANHHTLLFLFPLYLVFIIYIYLKTVGSRPQTTARKKPQKSTINRISRSRIQFPIYLNLLFFFILGLLLYLYLPLRAQSNPPVNWGIPDNWERFYSHLLRKQYGSMSFNFAMPRSIDLIVQQHLIYGKLLLAQFTPILFIFALLGIYAIFKKNKTTKLTANFAKFYSPILRYSHSPVHWLFIGIFLAYSLGLIYLINYRPTTEEITLAHVFFIPAYLSVAIWLAYGMNYLIQSLAKNKPQFARYTSWFFLILPLLPLISNYASNNRRGVEFGEHYAQNVLGSLPRNAILFSIRDSNNFTLAYQKFVENQRPDITIYDMSGGLFEDASGGYRKEKWRLPDDHLAQYRIQHFQRLLAENQNQRPIFFEIPVEFTPFPGYTLKHDAYFYRVALASDTSVPAFIPSEKGNLDRYYRDWEQHSLKTRIANFYIREALVDYHFQLGRYYLETGNLDTALHHFNRAKEIGNDMAQVHNNLGIVYYTLGKFDLAVAEYQQAIAIEPNNREAYYNLALYYQNIAKNPDLAQFYYRRFEMLQPK